MTIINERQTNWLNFYNSSLGKKIITGVTGLGLTLFVLFHMIANLVLLSDREAYNQLAHWLNSLSFLLYGVELILLTAVVFHIVVGISIHLKAKRSRPESYNQLESAGIPSKQSLSSRSMTITGITIIGFLVWHLLSFKFGTYYSTTIDGVAMRDLGKLVIEKFHNPVYAFGYLGFITFLGVHLRHGIWSAWQSLGVLNGRTSSLIYGVSLILAVVITLGFIALPLTIYFGVIG
ncbi:putative succinate dehydrogenase, cytochrome subunit [Hyella patelloides LEGE 07179]|uniref:Putative succinate dehydrogenase, cytochrome subunit n=1 Tax=Hyella patelloides LEGE 07179 TaxID=945734 RepID=A0A563VNH5_9CYAN|nr:succinate dehydrogenase cytochrome b subunit [Hyella patelloides]VEP12917.1 putative succinate dehydrogenase, cytochrome subunit [Hyella patelloides LEGE 07179]